LLFIAGYSIILGFQDITLAKTHIDGIVTTKAISIGKYKNQLSQAALSRVIF
jgi:hypothetical protein